MDPTSPPPSLSSSTNSQSATLELSLYARAQLEDLMVEGDLLEVSLDDTQQLWRILQACQPVQQERFMEHILEQMPPESLEKLKVKSEAKEKKKMKLKRKKDDIEIMSAEIKLEKKKKKKEKRDKELATPGTAPLTPQKKLGEKVKKEGKENKEKQKKKMKRKKAEKLLGPGNLPIKKEDIKEELIINVDGDEDDDDEVCSAKKCLRPLGDDINWVQCDSCEKWYHLLCIGMKQQPEEDEEFICRICTKKRSLQKAGGLKSKQKTDSTTPSQAATPTKQTVVPTASQEIVTKTVAMMEGVIKVQSSGGLSGRNSPVTVPSGHSSPSVVTTKGESRGASGRNSPALSASGHKTLSVMSLERNSPLTLGTGRNSSITLPMQAATCTKPPELTVKDRKSPLIFTPKNEMTKDGLPGLDTISQSKLSVQKAVESILPLDKDDDNTMICEGTDQTLVQKPTVKLAVITKPSSELTEVKSSSSACVDPLITSLSPEEGSQTQKDSAVSLQITDSQDPVPTNDEPSTSVASPELLSENVELVASDTTVKSETVAVTSTEVNQEIITTEEFLTVEDPKYENTMPDNTYISLSQSNVDHLKEFPESKQDDKVESMPEEVTSNEEAETKSSNTLVPESNGDPKALYPASEQMDVQLVKEASSTDGEQHFDDIEVAIESEILLEEPCEPPTSQPPDVEDPVLPVMFDNTPVAQPSSPTTLVKEPEYKFPDAIETLRPPHEDSVKLIATKDAHSKALDALTVIQEDGTLNEPTEPMEIIEESSENELKQESDSPGDSFPERVQTENVQSDSSTL